MKFIPIDFEKWSRGQMFYYFAKMAPTRYSLTVNIDVTKLRGAVQVEGLKVFPVYLWLVTKNLNHQIEFKVAEKDGQLGYYDMLPPLYADFHDDDKTLMPLSLTCHHATTDGYHIDKFIKALQADMDSFDRLINNEATTTADK